MVLRQHPALGTATDITQFRSRFEGKVFITTVLKARVVLMERSICELTTILNHELTDMPNDYNSAQQLINEYLLMEIYWHLHFYFILKWAGEYFITTTD